MEGLGGRDRRDEARDRKKEMQDGGRGKVVEEKMTFFKSW